MFNSLWKELHQAAGDDDLNQLLALIKKGAEVNSRNSYGGTALMIAAKRGFFSIVKALIENGANPNAVMSPPKDPHQTYTALHTAAQEGHNEIVDLLIRAGSNVNASTGYGETPLISAALYGNESTVNMLLQHGADKNQVTMELKTAADYAMGLGHMQTYELLISVQQQVVP